MFGVGVVEVVLFGVVVTVLVTLVVRAMTRPVMAAVGSGPAAAPTREWRLVLSIRLLGFLVGVVLAVLTWNSGQYGRGSMLALAVFGLCVLLATAVGETVVRPRRDPGPRTASLTPRRVRDYLPWTTPLVALLVVVTVGVLVLTTLTASDDMYGHARELSCANATTGSSHGPYPGSFYSVPLALALLVVLATAVLAARRVVDRPRGMAETEAGDDRLRRNSLDMVVAATGVAVAAPLTGIALVSGVAMHGLVSAVPSCAPGWYDAASVAQLLLALFSLMCFSLLLGRLVLVPGTR